MSNTLPGAASTTHNPRQRVTPPRVSATVNKLLAEIRAEIAAEDKARRLAQLHETDGILVLPATDEATRHTSFEHNWLQVWDERGSDVTVYRRHLEPDVWRDVTNMAGHWHPARWYGDETRVDAKGVKWMRRGFIMVTDDFGDLVEVQR